MLSTRTAMNAFINGWTHSRRMTWTITRTNLNDITQVRFGSDPAFRPAPDEFMILETVPDEAVSLIRGAFPNERHKLVVFTNETDAALEAYQRHAYRFTEREYLMALELETADLPPPEQVVEKVSTEEDRAWFNTARGEEVISPEVWTGLIRCYFIRSGDELVCEGRWVLTDETVAVVDAVHTAEAYRRRGLGKALMYAMLRDARREGATHSVLAASEDGHKLYTSLEYVALATMMIFES